jgi:septation ring formation regulator
VLEAVKEKQKPYSALGGNVNSIIEALEDIEKNQISISEGLANLREQEKVAQEAADRFDSELRIIKRYVEKRNLPGLPKDYLDLFFATSERLEALFKELGKVRINIDVVNHQLDTSTQDMEALKDATDDLVDHAVLAEQLMQYANRYKASDERIAGAIARSLQLFDRARNYDGAFNEISNALEMVEPGAAERIANVYNSHKEKPDYR